MPGTDSLKHAVAVGLGIGVLPRAMVSSGGAVTGLTAMPLSVERGTRALTVVYRENNQRRTAPMSSSTRCAVRVRARPPRYR